MFTRNVKIFAGERKEGELGISTGCQNIYDVSERLTKVLQSIVWWSVNSSSQQCKYLGTELSDENKTKTIMEY